MGRRKRRTHVTPSSEQAARPKLFVVRSGRVTPEVQTLVQELRMMFGPDIALRLRERRDNKIKDFTAVAGQLGVTHIVVLSQSQARLTMRIARFPRGPTLTFQILRFSLESHIKARQRRPCNTSSLYQTYPLLVLNNFGGTDIPSDVKLMKITFQQLFTTLNVHNIKLPDCRRVTLFDYNLQSGQVQVRQYGVQASANVSRTVSRLMCPKIPRLGTMQDISEYILKAEGRPCEDVSDSEVEDHRQDSRDCAEQQGRMRSTIRLTELGPRLSLKLTKVETGLLQGDVIFDAGKRSHQTLKG